LWLTVGLIGFQSAEHDAADASLQSTQGGRRRIAGSEPLTVIRAARTIHADLANRYPMHGVKRPVLEELVALSTFAREIVELSPGDAMPPVEIRPQTIWLESAVTAG